VDARTPNTREDFDDVPLREDVAPAAALLVGADASVESIVRTIALGRRVELHATRPGDPARYALLERRYDVVLLAGASAASSFASMVARLAPSAKTVVLAETVTVKSVTEAMQRGAVDVVLVPFDESDFGNRLLAAVERSRDERRREDRVARLKGICKRLSEAKTEFNEHARALKDDLREAREGIVERMDEVAMTAEYRTMLRQELDLEDLLRVGVEYLVGKTGPTNAAVFLPGSDGEWSLGAYVNCDCPRGVAQPMLDRLASDLCPELARQDELMRFEDTADFVTSLGLTDEALTNCEMVAWPCVAGGDCLAIFMLFRDKATGFNDGLASTIDALRGVFAEQVATVLRVHHRAQGGWPSEADDRDNDEWEDRKAA